MDVKISFCVIGSKSSGKSSIINKYLKGSGINLSDVVIEKENKILFEKNINNVYFKIKILEVNEPVKHFDYIKNTDFIFLNFDLLKRSTFEDIDEIWKSYLIDKVDYSNKLYLTGNFFKNDPHLTDRQEIDDLIAQEEKRKIEYFEIGYFSEKQLVDFIDDKILKAYQEKKANVNSNKCDNSGSCIIF